MKNTIKICSGLFALFTVFNSYIIAEAAPNGLDILTDRENKQEAAKDRLDPELEALHNEVAAQQKNAPPIVDATLPAPVTFEGDDISFDERNGEVFAKGHVKVTQLEARMTADALRGNTKSTDVYVDDKMHLLQVNTPAMVMDGYKTTYNYQKKTGTMENAKGKVDGRYIKGEKFEFYPNEMIIYNGSVTKCPAIKPDYHISAKKIEIWPDDHMVAYDVKFYIKNQVIYSMKKYETKIGKNQTGENTAFPRPSYRKSDGIGIRQDFETELQKNVNAYADLYYSVNNGFKNVYGIGWKNSLLHVAVEDGNYEDGDDNWIKKEPTLLVSYGSKQIGDFPFHYTFNSEYGKWNDGTKSSWHQSYSIYLDRDPIHFSPTLSLYTGFGYQIVDESYDHSQNNTLIYDVVLMKDLNSRLTVYTSYHYTKDSLQYSLFAYDTADIAKNLASGFSYKIDAKNRLAVEQSYDIAQNRTQDLDYYWYHDIHCAQMEVRYREKRNEVSVKFHLKNW